MEVEKLADFFEDRDITQFVEIVTEPEFSNEKLLEFQSEFGISSIDFHRLYILGLLDSQLPEDVVSEWVYNYRMYVRNGGSLKGL